MTFKMQFETDNEAFQPDLSVEIASILRKIAERIDHGRISGKVMDSNGNSVGTWEYDEED